MNRWYGMSVAALVLAVGLVLASGTQADEPAERVQLETVEDRASYAIGVSIGRDLKQQEALGLKPDLLVRGLRDALEDRDIVLSDEQLEQALMAMQEKAMAEQMRLMQEMAANNAREGQAYLQENRQKEGVRVTESGLQYEVVEQGDGRRPTADDQVVAHYRGTFLDGEVFDSSYDRGQPITLPVQGVIDGWSEALQLMPVGSKYRLVIPSDLAYGERGTGPIGPNQTLIFEVELLSIVGDE